MEQSQRGRDLRSGRGLRTFIVNIECDGVGDSGASEEEPCRRNESGEKHNGNDAVRLKRTSSAQGRDWEVCRRARRCERRKRGYGWIETGSE